MTTREISETFFDVSIRAELIIHIGTQLLDGCTSDAVEEAFNDDWSQIWEALGCRPTEDGESDMEDVSYYLRNQVEKQGYLVKFATPVPHRFTEHGYAFSWGYYTSSWIYAETYEEACQKAIEWQAEYVERKRKEEAEAA